LPIKRLILNTFICLLLYIIKLNKISPINKGVWKNG
jgi:hypothetical protein